MSLSVHVTSTDDAVVVALGGTADADRLTPLRGPMAAALTDTGLVVLDLEQVETIDADVLRSVIVGLLDDVRGGQLKIATRSPALRGALATARIHHLVALHTTVAEAITGPDAAEAGDG